MQLATIPLVLLSLLVGQVQATPVREAGWTVQESNPTARKANPAAIPEPCPVRFEHARPFGPGRPTAVVLGGLATVTVCRYQGNAFSAEGPGLPPNNKLANERTIGQRDTVQSLARAFDRLRPYPSQSGMPLCSAEFGGGFYIRFLYFDGRKSSLKVIPSGCPRAVAGRHGDWRLLSGDLRLRLMKIAPLPEEEG